MSKEEHEPPEEEEAEATVLPAREAMSLIVPDPAAGFMPDLDSLPTADAAGSASGEEAVSSEDRHEHFEDSDSASSQT